jgi:hypothetical protein
MRQIEGVWLELLQFSRIVLLEAVPVQRHRPLQFPKGEYHYILNQSIFVT